MSPTDSSSFSLKRVIFILVALSGLAMVYLFLQTDIVNLLTGNQNHPNLNFAVNRAIRLLLNDVFMLLLIFAWFNERSISRLALVIQLIDFFVLLPIYLCIKLYMEGDSEISSPLLSQFHRLIVNPTLMILLIPGVYFQRLIKQK